MTQLATLPYGVIIGVLFLTLFLFLFNIYTLYKWFALIEEYELLEDKYKDLKEHYYEVLRRSNI